MLTTPQKRFIWAREERFPDFSEFSYFHALLKRRRSAAVVVKERRIRERLKKPRWKPAAWTPWLWMK